MGYTTITFMIFMLLVTAAYYMFPVKNINGPYYWLPVIFFIYGQAGNMLLFFYLLHLQFILQHLLCIKTAKQRKKR